MSELRNRTSARRGSGEISQKMISEQQSQSPSRSISPRRQCLDDVIHLGALRIASPRRLNLRPKPLSAADGSGGANAEMDVVAVTETMTMKGGGVDSLEDGEDEPAEALLDREWDQEETEASEETSQGLKRTISGSRPAPPPYDPLIGEQPSIVPFGLGKDETQEAVQVPMKYSVEDTIKYIREVSTANSAKKKGFLHSHDRIYVTQAGILRGYVTMASLLTCPPATPLSDLIMEFETVMSEGTSWEEAAHRLRKAKSSAAPVIDSDGYLVAILNPTDLMQEMEIEATDDIMRFSGSGGGESYFGTPLLKLVASRCGWLVSLLMLQSVSSMILTHFQSVIEKHIVIALFLTMLTGTAGNAGNQSSAMVIRGLATGEINKKNKLKCLWRETKAACIAAVILSGASFGRVLMTPGSTMLATIAVSTAMGATVIGAVLFGTATPLLLDRFGIDPVNFASPALATLTDVSGVLILCTVASALLGAGV